MKSSSLLHALPKKRLMGLALFAIIACHSAPSLAQSSNHPWGTFEYPFSAASPWNSRPYDVVLDEFAIPASTYYPSVSEGAWSTGVFRANPSNQAVTIFPVTGKSGIWDPDAEGWRPSITIPRWPSDVVPATGSDGHAEIIDETTNTIHSFFQLKFSNGQWTASQYAWASLTDRGFGDPSHYFQGARAAGVPTVGGLIRSHEVDDGDPYYAHALAMSLTYNGMDASPTYIFPATSADTNAASTNTGGIPEGALVMLPANYDTSSIQNAKLRKVAETLKRYGAYVVDRNFGTPFAIYVENGSNFKLMGTSWDTPTANELVRMRQNLRQVVRVGGWLDGNDQPFVPDRRMNILSMRGSWLQWRGTATGTFSTWDQAVVFPKGSANVVQVNYSTRTLSTVTWAKPQAGEPFRLTSRCTGGGRLRILLMNAAGSRLYDSGELVNGATSEFTWPAGQSAVAVYAYSGASGQASSVSGTLISTAPLPAQSSLVTP